MDMPRPLCYAMLSLSAITITLFFISCLILPSSSCSDNKDVSLFQHWERVRTLPKFDCIDIAEKRATSFVECYLNFP